MQGSSSMASWFWRKVFTTLASLANILIQRVNVDAKFGKIRRRRAAPNPTRRSRSVHRDRGDRGREGASFRSHSVLATIESHLLNGWSSLAPNPYLFSPRCDCTYTHMDIRRGVLGRRRGAFGKRHLSSSTSIYPRVGSGIYLLTPRSTYASRLRSIWFPPRVFTCIYNMYMYIYNIHILRLLRGNSSE